MSILLDALRKSENSQKPVEPPNIHSNDLHMAEPANINKGLMAILLLVALLLIGWLVWRQYQPDTAVYRPPVELPAGRVAKAPTTPESQPSEEQQVEPKPAVTGNTRARTPVESYQPSAEERAIQQQAKTNAAAEKRAAARQEAARKNAPPPAAKLSENTTAPPSSSGANEPAAKTVVKTSTSEPADKKTGKTRAKESYQSPEPQPISYWELPDEIREAVPEIKFSVLVYADQPTNRFVLVNGERYVEGDSPTPGLVLEEIRRDGVVFSYRLYRFFVAR
jgi:general secretion pathway protein B